MRASSRLDQQRSGRGNLKGNFAKICFYAERDPFLCAPLRDRKEDIPLFARTF